jgi:hypothetical protein
MSAGAYHKRKQYIMKRTLFLLLAFTSFAIALYPAPALARSPKRTPSKTEKKSGGQKATSAEIILSAHGWSYVKGEWVHPDGYKYAKGQVLRTTAKTGKTAPEPPGKLALENAQKMTPQVNSAPASTKTEAEIKAEIRQKNLTPTAAPQTGSHL